MVNEIQPPWPGDGPGMPAKCSGNSVCCPVVVGHKPSVIQNFSHSYIRTNGGDVASNNRYYVADNIHVFDSGNECHHATETNAHKTAHKEFHPPEVRAKGNESIQKKSQVMGNSDSIIKAVFAILRPYFAGVHDGHGGGISKEYFHPKSANGGDGDRHSRPESSLKQIIARVIVKCSLKEAILSILCAFDATSRYKVDDHTTSVDERLGVAEDISPSQYPASGNVAPLIETTPPSQHGERYLTLMVQLDNCIKRERVVDVSNLESIIQKYFSPHTRVDFCASDSTFLYYPNISFADAHLNTLKNTIWADVYPLLHVPATDRWRMRLFNSWPSIIIHEVPVGNAKEGVLCQLDWYESVRSGLIWDSGNPTLWNNIKEIRCLTFSTLGTVSTRVSFLHWTDLQHFLQHGAYILGKKCHVSLYVPRAPRRGVLDLN